MVAKACDTSGQASSDKTPNGAPLERHGPQGASATLSLCMIVRNEEGNLPECLSTVKPYVDEIVVVDTGSDDRTVEVAQELGARVVRHHWDSDFSEARNFALDQCDGDWVLWLDGDDRLDGMGAHQLRDLLRSEQDRAYSFVLQNHGADTTRCFQLRLFPRLPGVRFEGRVHEQVAPSLDALGIPCHMTDIVVHHHGYSDAETLKCKLRRNHDLLKSELVDRPEDLDLRLRAAMSEADCGDLDAAIQGLSALLADPKCKAEASDLYVHGCCLLGKYYEKKGWRTHAGEAYRTAVAADGSHGLSRFFLGRHLLDEGAIDDALAELETAERIGIAESRFPVPVQAARAALYLNIGICLEAKGDIASAKAKYVQATEHNPSYAEAFSRLGNVEADGGDELAAATAFERAIALDADHCAARIGLGNIYFRSDRLDEAEQHFQKALEIQSDQPQAQFNLGAIALRRDLLPEAETHFRKAIQNGFRTPMSYTYLGATLSKQDKFREAIPRFEDALRLESDNIQAIAGAAEACFQMGDHKAAAVLARQLITLQPKNPTAYRFAGVCCLHLGLPNEARVMCQRALSLDPNEEVAKQVIDALAKRSEAAPVQANCPA